MSLTQQARRINYKWIGRKADPDAAANLVMHFGLHPVAARVLAARNCARIESASRFLNPDRSQLLDPFLLHDMQRAVVRIKQAVERREKILVYGDYDVDGCVSVAILVRALRSLGVDPAWFVPSRFTDGYGLHANIVRSVAEQGVGLIVTVDTGITGFEAAAEAKRLGVDLIITDHHRIGDIPDAYAVVHPAFPRSMYSFHDLCGAGVAFKLAQALLDKFPEELLDLVTLATVADQVPLLGENRVLVKEGLQRINREALCCGLAALIDVAGIAGKRITSEHLAFQLAPRINAVGRLAHAKRAVELLLTEDEREAWSIAHELNAYNRRRQVLQNQVEQEALAQIDAHPHWLEQGGLVVAGENWHEGVIGIVAGKLTERFWKSTLCISVNGEHAKGSGRAIPEFDLYRTLRDVQERTGVFTRFGGHEAAAGFSLRTKDLNRLQQSFWHAVRRNWFEDVELEPHIVCDAPLALGELSFQLVDDLRRLEPFGQGNPEPVLFIRDTNIMSVQTIGADDKHLKIWVKDNIGRTYPVLAFGRGHELDDWQGVCQRHLLVTVGDNHWNGQRTLQMQLVDAK
ncbi:MAG: single-stranded-DNA-specific exonuclease RecJ [Alicyclobacillus sp.]|nr:single-stranded-DNA-specific exonuclease RecJ [Alicyclobacillus sp.]